jgi:hypothetical protein
LRQNLIDPLWQNKNAPLKVIAFRGLFCIFEIRPDRRINSKITFHMTKLRNLLRCYAMEMGIKSIASAFDVSRNTVRDYQIEFSRFSFHFTFSTFGLI